MATRAFPANPQDKAAIDVIAPIFGLDPEAVHAVGWSWDLGVKTVWFDVANGANGRVAFEIRPAGKESR